MAGKGGLGFFRFGFFLVFFTRGGCLSRRNGGGEGRFVVRKTVLSTAIFWLDWLDLLSICSPRRYLSCRNGGWKRRLMVRKTALRKDLFVLPKMVSIVPLRRGIITNR